MATDVAGVAPVLPHDGSYSQCITEDSPANSTGKATPPTANGITQCETLLQADLSLYPESKGIHQVTVSRRALTCVPLKILQRGGDSSSSKAIVFQFAEVVGCQCMKGKKAEDIAAYVTVFAYTRRPGLSNSNKKRQRNTVVLMMNHLPTYEENFQEASKWQAVIHHLSKHWQNTPLLDVASICAPAPNRLMILINPHSGPGKAVSMFKQRIVPVLAEANIQYQPIITKYAGHAREMMLTVDLDEWYGFVIVSGDGLVYEVINGLMERADWEKAIKKPLGVLPGGSGNALCTALLTHAGEPITESSLVSGASFLMAKHRVLPMDLVAVDTQKGRVYSFLAVAWGIISDVDIESERYRRLGNARFTVGAMVRILSLRHYRGRLSFVPVGDHKLLEKKQPSIFRRSVSELGHLDSCIPGTYIPRSMSNIEDIVESGLPSMRRASTSDLPDKNAKPNGRPHSQLEGLAEEINDGSHPVCSTSPTSPKSNSYYLEDLEPLEQLNNNPDVEGLTDKLQSSCESKATQPACDSAGPSVKTPLLVPLDQTLPDNWVSFEDEFVFVVIMYQTHLATDYMAAPMSKLDDGVMHMGFLRGSPSRKRVLQLIISMADGTHLKYINEDFQVLPVHAFRLEPLTVDGTVTVDGELMDYGPIQGQVLPGMSRVMGFINNPTQRVPTTLENGSERQS